MKLEKQKEHQPHRIGPPVGEPPQQKHGHEDRCLHEHPAETVPQSGAPFRLVELPVSGVDEEQADEHHDGDHRHHDQEDLECMQ